MAILRYDHQVGITGQISTGDLANLSQLGYQTLICNRPDDEAHNQPSIEEIEKNAAKHKLTVIYLPIVNNDYTSEAIKKTTAILSEGKNTLMYCRAGRRSAVLWALSRISQGLSPKVVYKTLEKNNQDLEKIKPLIIKSQHHL